MENQRYAVFRQKNRWGLTVLAVVLCLMFSPLMGVSVFMPEMFAFLPVIVLMLLGFVGPISASVCMGLFIGMCSLLFSIWGGVIAVLLIVPVVVASVVAMEREQPFWYAVAAGGVTMFASMGAAIAVISSVTGSDIVTAITQMVSQGLDVSGEMGNLTLDMLIQMGVFVLPEGAQGSAALLDPQMRQDMISSLLMMTDSVLRLEMPMQMATGSVTAGLLGQAVLRRGVLSRGRKVDYPRLSTWRVPKGWGRILCGTLLVLYFLAQIVPQSMNTMFYVFSGVFDRLFALQGIAAVCYIIEDRGKHSALKGVAFVLGYFVLGSAAMILGIADQAIDFTHRRIYLDKIEKPFDPRHGA